MSPCGPVRSVADCPLPLPTSPSSIQQLQLISKGMASADDKVYHKILSEMEQNSMKAYAQHNRKANSSRSSRSPPPTSPGAVSPERQSDPRVAVYSPLKLDDAGSDERSPVQGSTAAKETARGGGVNGPAGATAGEKAHPGPVQPAQQPVMAPAQAAQEASPPPSESRGPLMYTERLVRLTKDAHGALGLTISGGCAPHTPLLPSLPFLLTHSLLPVECQTHTPSLALLSVPRISPTLCPPKLLFCYGMHIGTVD